MIVHLPHYAQLEEDYRGQYALLGLICHLFNLPVDLERIRSMGEEQYQKISRAVEANPEARELLKTMEENYGEGLDETRPSERMPHLSPEVEEFLKEMEQNFDPD